MAAPESDAFSLRKQGVNPIALELDRLAEQRALQQLGAPRPTGLPGAREMNAPSLTATTVSPESPAELTPSTLAKGSDLAGAYEQFRESTTPGPFEYDPDDPKWGGLEEDEAYQLWSQQVADAAKSYPDMRDAFLRGVMGGVPR